MKQRVICKRLANHIKTVPAVAAHIESDESIGAVAQEQSWLRSHKGSPAGLGYIKPEGDSGAVDAARFLKHDPAAGRDQWSRLLTYSRLRHKHKFVHSKQGCYVSDFVLVKYGKNVCIDKTLKTLCVLKPNMDR